MSLALAGKFFTTRTTWETTLEMVNNLQLKEICEFLDLKSIWSQWNIKECANQINLYYSLLNIISKELLFQFSAVTQLCPTLCDPIDCSTPGFPVHHQLPELAQTHVYRVGDAIQPSHPLSSPPPSFNVSIRVFSCWVKNGWVSSSYQVAKVLELQLQYQSCQQIFRTDFLQDWQVGSPYSPRNSQESYPTLQFKSINFLALSFLYGPTLTSIHDYWKKP